MPVAELDIDLEHNRADGSIPVSVDELFINGELRLQTHPGGWTGIVLERGSYYYVDTRLDQDDFLRKLRIGPRSVTNLIQERITDPAAGGLGTFIRRVEP